MAAKLDGNDTLDGLLSQVIDDTEQREQVAKALTTSMSSDPGESLLKMLAPPTTKTIVKCILGDRLSELLDVIISQAQFTEEESEPSKANELYKNYPESQMRQVFHPKARRSV